MASLVQLEEGNFHNGLLPPLRELLLEIQVNKLIQEYLFASNADEMCASLQVESSEKETKASDPFYAADRAVQSACDAPCVMATGRESAHDSHLMQTVRQSITRTEENEINGKDQMATGESPQTRYAAHSVENEYKLAYKAAHLNKADSFPCTSKAQLQVGTLKKANTGMQVSGKKPPRPPRMPKSELGSSLSRCCSDNGAYMPSSRRVKPERKRKAGTPSSSFDTSIFALLFTLCFAVIMIAQGFWSQDSQNLTAYSSDAPSLAATFVGASSKVLPVEVSLTGPAGELASMDGVSAQFYATRKLQAQHLSDMNRILHLRAG